MQHTFLSIMVEGRFMAITLAFTVASAMPAGAQTAPPRQTDADAYTRYELSAPGSPSSALCTT